MAIINKDRFDTLTSRRASLNSDDRPTRRLAAKICSEILNFKILKYEYPTDIALSFEAAQSFQVVFSLNMII